MFLLSLDLFRFLEKTFDAGMKEAFVLARVRFHASKQNGTLDERAQWYLFFFMEGFWRQVYMVVWKNDKTKAHHFKSASARGKTFVASIYFFLQHQKWENNPSAIFFRAQQHKFAATEGRVLAMITALLDYHKLKAPWHLVFFRKEQKNTTLIRDKTQITMFRKK
jgi:hypothetical protein